MGRVKRADTFWLRLFGLMGRNPGKFRQALWLVPCTAIHTLGMRAPIDVLFLDRRQRVVSVAASVKPFRVGPACRKAYSVVESFHGFWDLSRVAPGDQMELKDET